MFQRLFPVPAMSAPSWLRSFGVEIHRRGVHRAAAAYAAAVFVLLQAADLLLKAVTLPEVTFRLLAIACFVGFPVILALAWMFDFTGGRITRARQRVADSGDSETAPVRMIATLVVAGAVIAVTGVLLVGTLRGRTAGDGRVIAVFPFRTAGLDVMHWAEGLPDLLSSVLDGTAGVTVADPWALWKTLRGAPHDIATSPDPERAAQLARRSRAERFVLGSIVDTGDSVDVNVRIYDARSGRPLYGLTATSSSTDLRGVVRDLAVQFIAARATEQQVPAIGRIDAGLTTSPEALKAYVLARLSMRRGLVDSADVAIREALAHDSLFTMAIVEAVVIQSWVQSLRGQPYAGLRELVARGLARDSLLRERDRLRLHALDASIRTDGAAAARLLHGILASDSTDLHAWAQLQYVSAVYGWQYGSSDEDAIRIAERVLRLDSGYVPMLAARAWQAVASQERSQYDRLIRLLSADTSSHLARASLGCLRSIVADDSTFRLLAAAAARDRLESIGLHRCLRSVRPDRSEALLKAWTTSDDPWLVERGVSEQGRLSIARGRLRSVGRQVEAGELRPDVALNLRLALGAASLVGVGDTGTAAATVGALAASLPVDSALAYFEKMPVWWIGWLIGAYHAQSGDTVLARRWQRTFEQFPSGGSPAEWAAAVRADIEARLAMRRGDAEAALASARRAFLLWSIHTENQVESMPEPHMRFHLAMLHQEAGNADSARSLLRSLVPPTGWLGFLTARAAFELGKIDEQMGSVRTAERDYTTAWILWSGGGTEIEPWRSQVRQALTRLRRSDL
ncbi:MAG TPA: hypothetical protein VFZ24_06520 [Longimicrobiales bacterium]